MNTDGTQQTGPADESDAAVIGRSLDVPEAFAELFDRHARAIHRYLAQRLGVDPADDLVAQTFLVAFERRGRYQRDQPYALPWLYGIATNLVRRHRRDEVGYYRALARTGRDPLATRDRDGMAERVAERVDAGRSVRRLAAAMAGLSAGDRDVLLLYAVADLSYEEIARAVGIPVGTVRSRLHRARRRVRTDLGVVEPAAEHTEGEVLP